MKAVLFDLDGTLTNTIDDIADSMNHALRLYNLPEHTVEEYKYMVGNGARKIAERAVGEHQEFFHSVLQAYQKQYETHNAVKTRAYDGIPELLHKLMAKGIRICVLSNKPHGQGNQNLRAFQQAPCRYPYGRQPLLPGCPLRCRSGPDRRHPDQT